MELDERWDCRIRVPKRSRKRFDKARYPGFKYKYDGPGRFHFEASGLTRPQRDEFLKKAREDKFVFNSAERSFRRSSDYRERFLEANPGPWRCRYCHRRIDCEEQVTVDHVIPVDAVDPFGSYPAGKRAAARRLLGCVGMRSVNDPRNLAPSCKRCNSSKGNRMGLWVVRGYLGAHAWYWPVVRCCQAAALALAACLAVWAVSGMRWPL